MSCKAPILVGPDGYKSMVRCGRCTPCRIRKKQAWVARMMLERADHVAARFVTLTYEDPAKQKAPLVYDDLQLFLKRYRYYYGPLRFYAIGEYGEKNGNAHWHLIIYGHPPEPSSVEDVQRLQAGKGIKLLNFRPWKAGFAYDGTVTLKSIGYVASYATKELPRGRRNISESSRDPGIGLGRIVKLAEMTAAQWQGRRLDSWPGRLSVFGKHYPLIEGGQDAFRAAYLNAGGLPPASLTPEDRHMVSMEQFADLGTRIQGTRAFNADFKIRTGKEGLIPNGQGSF